MVRRSAERKRARRRNKESSDPSGKPFRQLSNPLSPVEVLSEEQNERIHDASMRILEEVGIDFLDSEALSLWEAAGAKVDRKERRVWPDRNLVLETVARAPAEFALRARNPEHTLHIGGDSVNFATVGAAPYYSDLERGRRPGTIADYRRMVKLAQFCGPIHMVEGLMVEPQDVPVQERHLEKWFSQLTLSDKTHTTAAHGHEIATDYVNMAAVAFGGYDEIRRQPVFASNINANSPLRFDERMLGALIVYDRTLNPRLSHPSYWPAP